MFNSESKSISTLTMWRELKGLGLNSCVALRKPLSSEANRKKKKKKGFSLPGSIKIGLWSNGRRSCGLMSPDLPCSRVMLHQGKKRGRWSDAPIMPSACCTSLWGQCYDVGLLQLVRSRFSSIMCPKNEASWLPEYTEWPGFYIIGFFLPWWHGPVYVKQHRVKIVILCSFFLERK